MPVISFAWVLAPFLGQTQQPAEDVWSGSISADSGTISSAVGGAASANNNNGITMELGGGGSSEGVQPDLRIVLCCPNAESGTSVVCTPGKYLFF